MIYVDEVTTWKTTKKFETTVIKFLEDNADFLRRQRKLDNLRIGKWGDDEQGNND